MLPRQGSSSFPLYCADERQFFFANLCEEKRKLELVLWSLATLFFSLDLALFRQSNSTFLQTKDGV